MSKNENWSSEATIRSPRTGDKGTMASSALGQEEIEAFRRAVQTDNTKFRDFEELATAMRRFFQTKSQPKTGGQALSDVYSAARTELVQEFDLNRSEYVRLTETVQDKCKQLLRDNKSILSQDPSARTKEISSVKKKSQKESQGLSKMTSSIDLAGAKMKLYQRLVDLSGVRILVYFPQDVVKVVEMIRDSDDLEILGSVVSFSRGRTDHRKEDREAQKEGAMLNYTDGPWIEKRMTTEGIIRRWKNAGYRAVHLHVRLRPKDDEGHDEGQQDSKSEPGASGAGEFPRPDAHTSTARGSIVDNDQQSGKPESSGQGEKIDPIAKLNFPKDKVTEIQISTVVMHAWSQVEHDVIYKNPHHIPINNSVASMLDAINGMSINSEIMLDELKMAVNGAQALRDNTMFSWCPERFPLFFQEEYLIDNEDWMAHPRWVAVLSMVLCSRAVPTQNLNVSTVSTLRNFVTQHQVLDNRSKQADLALAILGRLSIEFNNEYLERLEQGEGPFAIADASINTITLRRTLYTWLLAANAFSIMVAIGGQPAINKFQERFGSSLQSLQLINRIILGMEVELDDEKEKTANDFANEFLQTPWFEAHDIAVTLANLWIFIDIDEQTGSGQRIPYSRETIESIIFQPSRGVRSIWTRRLPTVVTEFGRSMMDEQRKKHLQRAEQHPRIKLDRTIGFQQADCVPVDDNFRQTRLRNHAFIGFGEEDLTSMSLFEEHELRAFRSDDDSVGGIQSNETILMRRFDYIEIGSLFLSMGKSWTKSFKRPGSDVVDV